MLWIAGFAIRSVVCSTPSSTCAFHARMLRLLHCSWTKCSWEYDLIFLLFANIETCSKRSWSVHHWRIAAKVCIQLFSFFNSISLQSLVLCTPECNSHICLSVAFRLGGGVRIERSQCLLRHQFSIRALSLAEPYVGDGVSQITYSINGMPSESVLQYRLWMCVSYTNARASLKYGCWCVSFSSDRSTSNRWSSKSNDQTLFESFFFLLHATAEWIIKKIHAQIFAHMETHLLYDYRREFVTH